MRQSTEATASLRAQLAATGAAALLAACGGGRSGDTASPPSAGSPAPAPAPAPATVSVRDAWRLADQSTFGATEALVSEIRTQGRAAWIAGQMARSASRYTSGNGDAIHKNTSNTGFCDQAAYAGQNCWRDWYSSQPLVWDFYRNATQNADQLRQRVAFALQQIVVVNDLDVEGTDHAWGNHHLVLGGPDDVGVDSWELQGRWIPTLSVDQYAATLLGWFGASPAQLDAVLPNLKNFGSARTIGFL